MKWNRVLCIFWCKIYVLLAAVLSKIMQVLELYLFEDGLLLAWHYKPICSSVVNYFFLYSTYSSFLKSLSRIMNLLHLFFTAMFPPGDSLFD